jgi:hypothetical protein
MIPTKPKASAKFPKKLHKYQKLHKKKQKKNKKKSKKIINSKLQFQTSETLSSHL